MIRWYIPLFGYVLPRLIAAYHQYIDQDTDVEAERFKPFVGNQQSRTER